MSYVLIAILVIIIALLVFSIPAFKVKREEFKRTGKHPKGHYTGLGMALGIAMGMPIGIALGFPGLGPAFGLPVGLALGLAWEKKHEKELRPLTDREVKMQQRLLAVTAGLAVLGVIVFLLFAFVLAK